MSKDEVHNEHKNTNKMLLRKLKETDISGDTAIAKPCAGHEGVWGRGVKNPPILNVGTEWDEWLPSRPGCLNHGKGVSVTHPTGSWESPTTDLTFPRIEKFLAYVGNRTCDRPAHNESDILVHHTSTIGSGPHPTSSVQRVYFLADQASSDGDQNAWGYTSVPSHAIMAWTETALPFVYHRSTFE
jgi:hypothetical protein